jgi:hypothetical protein
MKYPELPRTEGGTSCCGMNKISLNLEKADPQLTTFQGLFSPAWFSLRSNQEQLK